MKTTSEAPAAKNYGLTPELDPSPVGFHDSYAKRVLNVSANLHSLWVDVEQVVDDEKGDLVEVIISGNGLDAHRMVNGAAQLKMPARGTLRALADSLRYAADRAEALGMFDSLPGAVAGGASPRLDESDKGIVGSLRGVTARAAATQGGSVTVHLEHDDEFVQLVIETGDVVGCDNIKLEAVAINSPDALRALAAALLLLNADPASQQILMRLG